MAWITAEPNKDYLNATGLRYVDGVRMVELPDEQIPTPEPTSEPITEQTPTDPSPDALPHSPTVVSGDGDTVSHEKHNAYKKK